MLYADRINGEATSTLGEIEKNGGSWRDFEAAEPELETEQVRSWRALEQLDSPWVGCLIASRALTSADKEESSYVFASGMAVAYFRGDDSAGNALLSARYLSTSEAVAVYRAISQVRNVYAPPCGGSNPVIFPKPN